VRSDTEYLRLAVEIATESRASGNHPFGALLVGPEGDVLPFSEAMRSAETLPLGSRSHLAVEAHH
jgi:tRNA(Arg) A34 adenosine deaminase TadA